MKQMLFTALVALLCHQYALSQKKEYFDDKWKPVDKKDMATYYRTVKKSEDKFLVRSYTLADDRLQMEAVCKTVEPKMVYDGKVTNYYENGTVNNEGYYKDGKKWGSFKYFNKNGSPSQELVCRDRENKYIQYWSKTGKPILNKGNGAWDEYDKDKGETQHIEFHDSLMTVSYVIRHTKMDTVYYTTTEAATVKNGVRIFYQEVERKMGKYPVEARRAGIQGNVFVGFIVNKDGTLEEIETVKGIGGGCDEVAEESIKQATAVNWIPATYNGKPVKFKMILPVAFKL